MLPRTALSQAKLLGHPIHEFWSQNCMQDATQWCKSPQHVCFCRNSSNYFSLFIAWYGKNKITHNAWNKGLNWKITLVTVSMDWTLYNVLYNTHNPHLDPDPPLISRAHLMRVLNFSVPRDHHGLTQGYPRKTVSGEPRVHQVQNSHEEGSAVSQY